MCVSIDPVEMLWHRTYQTPGISVGVAVTTPLPRGAHRLERIECVHPVSLSVCSWRGRSTRSDSRSHCHSYVRTQEAQDRSHACTKTEHKASTHAHSLSSSRVLLMMRACAKFFRGHTRAGGTQEERAERFPRNLLPRLSSECVDGACVLETKSKRATHSSYARVAIYSLHTFIAIRRVRVGARVFERTFQP